MEWFYTQKTQCIFKVENNQLDSKEVKIDFSMQTYFGPESGSNPEDSSIKKNLA